MEIHLEHKFLSVKAPIHMTLGDLFLRMSEACCWEKCLPMENLHEV